MEPLLQIRDLRVAFQTDEGSLPAVDGVDLDLHRGEILGLVGESGSGKSVTALSILRLLPTPAGRIVTGSVRFDGRDLVTEPVAALRDIRGRQISMIFQEPMTALSPLHRVGRQLVETLQLHLPMGNAEAARVSVEWLGRVGIPDPAARMHAYPYQLSGGMRQRVMIAMALMLEPSIVIADEPTTALDVTVQAQIFALLRERKNRDTAVLLITHDMGVVWEMCTRVAVMYAGQLVETGPVREVLREPLHPYTQGLLAAMPSLTGPRGNFRPIPGQVPSPLAYPRGCRFRDRCPFAFDRCSEPPPLVHPAPDRANRCFLSTEAGAPTP